MLLFVSCKGIQDSLGFWIPRRGFLIPGTWLQFFLVESWIGFQSLVGFRIRRALFRIPKPRIPDSTSKNFTDSRTRIPSHGPMLLLTFCYISSVIVWPQCKSHVDHIIIGRWTRKCSREKDYWSKWLIIKVNCILSNSGPDLSTKSWCHWSSVSNTKILLF